MLIRGPASWGGLYRATLLLDSFSNVHKMLVFVFKVNGENSASYYVYQIIIGTHSIILQIEMSLKWLV